MNSPRNDEGSFTVEASLLLPIIMMISMLLLFFCLYSYQKSILFQIASATAERAAFNWDNSHKQIDGSFTNGQHDSLYWRIGEDHLLASLFGWGEENGSAVVALPLEAAEGDLAENKLGHAGMRVPDNMPGELSFKYELSGRRINAELGQLLKLPILDEILTDGGEPKVEAQSLIVEPVEFIRTIELMRYFGAKFQGKSASGNGSEETQGAMKQKDASDIVGKLKKK